MALETEVKAIENESMALVAKATELQIKTIENYKVAVDFLQMVKGMQKKIAETFGPIVSKAYATWKEATEQRNRFAKPLTNAEAMVKSKMQEYDREQQRIADEAQAKIDAQARKEREEAELRAKNWEAKGNTVKAEQIRLQAESKPVPVVKKAVPKTEGIKYITDWKYEIIDINLIPKEYWTVDESKIARVVKATKGTLQILGLKIYSEKRIAAGSK